MVCVASMIDIEDMNLAALVVDAIPDPVFTASGAPEPFERSVQSSAHSMRFASQGAVDELPRRERGIGWEPVAQGPLRAGRQYHRVRFGPAGFVVWICFRVSLFHEPAVAP